MAQVHLRLDGTWAPCRATRRRCPRVLHLPLGLTAARALPQAMLTPLIEALEPPTETFSQGARIWQDSAGLLHRDHDLPAVDFSGDGLLEWHRHGEMHRDHDRPASIDGQGTRMWFQHGNLHRDGGRPAVTYTNGNPDEYWVNGTQLS